MAMIITMEILSLPFPDYFLLILFIFPSSSPRSQLRIENRILLLIEFYDGAFQSKIE